jgi:hypothetical protein
MSQTIPGPAGDSRKRTPGKPDTDGCGQEAGADDPRPDQEPPEDRLDDHAPGSDPAKGMHDKPLAGGSASETEPENFGPDNGPAKGDHGRLVPNSFQPVAEPENPRRDRVPTKDSLDKTLPGDGSRKTRSTGSRGSGADSIEKEGGTGPTAGMPQANRTARRRNPLPFRRGVK